MQLGKALDFTTHSIINTTTTWCVGDGLIIALQTNDRYIHEIYYLLKIVTCVNIIECCVDNKRRIYDGLFHLEGGVWVKTDANQMYFCKTLTK